jgi:alpha-glucosidase (family GH31 glycosyl hydrolase)
VEIFPSNPGLDERVRIIFYADKGNKALAGYEGDVYMQTGIITNEKTRSGEWKYYQDGTKDNDKRLKLTNIAPDIFSTEFIIQDFYGIDSGENVEQLAFLFFDDKGERVAGEKNGEAILVAVNNYIAKKKALEIDSSIITQRKYISHRYEWGKLIILTDHGELKITPFTNDIIRIQNLYNTGTYDSSTLINTQAQHIQLEIQNKQEFLLVNSGNLKLNIQKNPLTISFSYHNSFLLKEASGYYKNIQFSGVNFHTDRDEKFRGLGYTFPDNILNNKRYNIHYQPDSNKNISGLRAYDHPPVLLSSNKYILLFDTYHQASVDIAKKQEGILTWNTSEINNTYFIIAGNTFRSVEKSFLQLTNQKTPLPFEVCCNLNPKPSYDLQQYSGTRFPLTPKDLQKQVTAMLHANISGLPYLHSQFDILHRDANTFDLIIRKIQLASYMPVCDISETWTSKYLHDLPSDYQTIVQSTIRYRKQLFPFFYTLAWEYISQNELIAKPLFFNYPDAATHKDQESSYLLGNTLLVSPATELTQKNKAIYLPKGSWYDIYNGHKYQGKQTIEYPLTIKHIPVFIKAGSFLPSFGDYDYSADTLRITYYPSTKAGNYNGRIYEDDGGGLTSWNKKNYQILNFFATEEKKKIIISLKKQFHDYPGRIKKKRIILRILDFNKKPKKILLNGERLPDKNKKKQNNYYTIEGGDMLLYVDWGDTDCRIEIPY